MRLTRRGDGSHYDQVSRGVQGEPLGRPRRDRARPARPGRGAHADPRAAVRALRRGPRRPRGDRAARARRARHARAAPLRRPDRRRRAPAPTGTPTSGPSADELIATSIHFLPVHRLTWFRERYPAQPPLPVAERAGDEVLSLPLSPAHSDDDILDAVDAVRRVHARFTRMRTPQGTAAVARQAARADPDRRHADALAVAYILLKIDVQQTWDVLTSANLWWFALAVTIMIVTALPMALRWQWLLAAQGIVDRFWWLTRAYFVSYTAGQILPTSIGGDAVRIFETAKRHPGRSGDLTAIVLHRAGPRRRGDGAARRDRVRARDRPLRRQRLPLARGSVRLRHPPADRPLLLPVGAPAARAAAPAARPRSASSGRCARSTTASTTTAATPACC